MLDLYLITVIVIIITAIIIIVYYKTNILDSISVASIIIFFISLLAIKFTNIIYNDIPEASYNETFLCLMFISSVSIIIFYALYRPFNR